ncbi:hypothetical protein GCM10027589_09000 [Actinocorallia lasiicapitis]
MTGEEEARALAAAVGRAQVAMVNLVRMMAAKGISRAQLGLILPAGWPVEVERWSPLPVAGKTINLGT